MTLENQAAWAEEIGKPLKIGPAPIIHPGPGQLLIRNHAIAINPVDWLVRDLGVIVKKWPTILGLDVAGEVAEVGSDVTNIAIGQRVLAHAVGLLSGKTEDSAFQKYTIVRECATSLIPDHIEYHQAAVIPLALSTAGQGMYLPESLGLPYPSTNPKPSGKAIIVWGGSSSVGCNVIQLAKASGLEVVTTASPKNFEFVKSLGAKAVFDHKSETIVEDLLSALDEADVIGGYDGTYPIEICRTTAYSSQAISGPDTTKKIAQVLDRFGGGTIAIVGERVEGLPSNVKLYPGEAFSLQIFTVNANYQSSRRHFRMEEKRTERYGRNSYRKHWLMGYFGLHLRQRWWEKVWKLFRVL